MRKLLTILALGVAGCTMPTSSDLSPGASYRQLAAAPADSTTVTSISPTSGARGETLDIRVFGSGFNATSQVRFAINGVPTNDVTVNSTQFVSSEVLIANVTIQTDADLALYDVVVTAVGGKPGIGTESFLVTIEETDLPTLGGSTSGAVSINDQGVIVGMTTDRIGERDQLQYPVRWDRAGRRWKLTRLTAVPTQRAVANAINASNVIVGMSDFRATVWLPDGTTVDLGPGCATGINASNYIVGVQTTPQGYVGVVWKPVQGTWVPQAVPDAWDPNTAPLYACEFSPLRAINNAGVIAGWAFWQSPAKWVPVAPGGPWGNMILIAPGPDGWGINGGAFAINEAGDIAGTLTDPNEGPGPHLWRADGTEYHYTDYGSGVGFAFGINDNAVPDIAAAAGKNGRSPVAIFGDGSNISRLTRAGGTFYFDGAWDVSNSTATEPMRVVGAVGGRPKVWTYRAGGVAVRPGGPVASRGAGQ